MNRSWRFSFILLSMGVVLSGRSYGQLLASDDFESYVGSPVGQSGGSGDWTGNWGANSQYDGGNFLNTDSKIDGVKVMGSYGSSGTAGTSVSRPFPDCTSNLTIRFSMRADYDVASSGAPTGARRLAFTIRNSNGASHFDNQRLSFFFAANTNRFQWFDGVDRTNSTVVFASNHIYDVVVAMQPVSRNYQFTASNRTTGAAFSYSGAWTTGTAGQPIGSVAFLMRGPAGGGNDAFLDSVSVSAPDYTPPPITGIPIVEGDSWRYFKGTSTPAVQGTNLWYNIAYNDSGWLGPAPSGFGYGDCDDKTEVSDMASTYWSIYTRKVFVVGDVSAINRLTLAVDYDDGIVAYINGVEVARRNMPGGSIINTTPASSGHESSRGETGANPQPKEFITLSPSLLYNGTNVIAVSGHNSTLASTDFTLIAELYPNASLVRGPFIQMPDAGNKITVAWSTAALADGVVDYGLDLSYGSGTVSNGAQVRDHAIVLSGLLPGTSYYYRVRSNGEILSAGNTFTTRADTNQNFRFVVIGDHGQGTDWMYNIANRINARIDFDAMLTVGDNIYGDAKNGCNVDGAPGWYDPFWFKLYGPSMKRVPVFPALGNHDKDTADGQYQVDYFYSPTNGPSTQIEKNYSFDYGNVHFIVIDSDPFQENNSSTMAAITSWLSNDLANATQPWKIALYHHPAFTSQGSHNDNVRVKEQIIPILKAHGVQYIFQGHNHFYERINAINGIHYSTCGACGAFLYGVSNRKEYSAQLVADKHSYTVVDINGGRLKLEQFDEGDVKIDEFNLDINHEFNIDGLLDNPSWLRANNGLRLYAAIRGYNLYVATQDAGEGSDHFLYVADTLSTQRAANWAKSGTIMQWGAFLADENDGAFQGWFGENQQSLTDFDFYKSMTSGLNNNSPYGTNGVMEGSIDLAAHFGTFPQQLYLAAAPYGNADAGALNSGFQVPAGNGDGDIQSNEFLMLNARDIALDLPLAAAGSDQSVEAGMWAVINGGGSTSPSGLPLSYLWAQTSGPDVTTANLDQPYAAFVITSNVAVNTDVTFRLRVNDGRFDSDDDFVTVTLFAMMDNDGDGLSNFEETTGFDNVLTVANPSGNITNPNAADSDGDGANDGDEALAGTNPGNSNSVFKVVSTGSAGAGLIIVDWNTVSGKTYHVQSTENIINSGWSDFMVFMATTSVSRIFDTNAVNVSNRYYRMTVEY